MGFFQRVVKRSSGPISRIPGGERVAVKLGVVQMEKVNNQMGQGRSVWKDEILILSERPGVTNRGSGCLVIGNDVLEVKKWCGVQVVARSFQKRDAVMNMLGWRTWDEKWPGSRKGETGWWSSRAGRLDGEEFAKVRGLGRLQGVQRRSYMWGNRGNCLGEN